jgi:hypothetical protein
MAKELNLEFTRLPDGGVKVTWQDPVLAEFSRLKSEVYAAVFGLGSIAFLLMGFVSMWFLLVSLLWMFGGIIMFKTARMEQRAVTFTPSEIIHEGRSYPTEQITRFEYGSRHALTGQAPVQGKDGPAADPNLIRMWLNDSSPIELSQNNWQTQVNHQIRDALDRALTAVRQEQVEAERVATYGQQDDKGMPDY